MTDTDLQYVQGLTQIKELWLGEGITDAGLVHLQGLTRLEKVRFLGTKVSDKGLQDLQQALPNCKIDRGPPTEDERHNWAAPISLAVDGLLNLEKESGTVLLLHDR